MRLDGIDKRYIDMQALTGVTGGADVRLGRRNIDLMAAGLALYVEGHSGRIPAFLDGEWS